MHYYENINDYISHHGIKGQKWGKRNGPPYPLGVNDHSASEKKAGWKSSLSKSHGTDRDSLKALYKTKSANLDKWGKDENHNVLYLSGVSGSGKSTLARQMGKRFDADVIHLDFYYEKIGTKYQSKEFNGYLDKEVPDWRKLTSAFKDKNWDLADRFANAIESYGKEQHKKGRKVIAEGVELMDDTVHVGRDFYRSKPYAMVSTSAATSMFRSARRDGIKMTDDIFKNKAISKWMKSSKIRSAAVSELALKGKRAVDMDKIIADLDSKPFDKYWDEQFQKAINERR